MILVLGDRSAWLDYAKTLLVLTGICLLAVVIVKSWLPKIAGVSTVTNPNYIRVLARQSVEPRKTLYLVKAGQSVMMIASAGDDLQFMTMLDEQDFPAEDQPSTQGNNSAFRRVALLLADRNRRRS